MPIPVSTTWTQRGNLPAGFSLAAFTKQVMATNGTILVAVGADKIATTTDGLTWTNRTHPGTGDFSSVAWNGSVFCVVSYGSSSTWTSPDGITWTLHTGAMLAQNWVHLIWNGYVFFALADGAYTYKGASSPDGVTWTALTIPFNSPRAATAVDHRIFIVSGIDSNTYYSDDNGFGWTSAITYSGASDSDIDNDGVDVCIIESNGARGLHSTSGTTFGSRNVLTGLSYDGYSIGWSGEVFWALAVYGDGTAYSADGVAWTLGGNLPAALNNPSSPTHFLTKMVVIDQGGTSYTTDAPLYVPDVYSVKTGYAGLTNSWRRARILVPAGMTTLKIKIFGGTGDMDLYVNYGFSPMLADGDPNDATYDFVSSEVGQYFSNLVGDDYVTIPTPTAGLWYIDMFCYTDTTGWRLEILQPAEFHNIFWRETTNCLES